MTDCVFCSILDDEIPSYGVYEDDETYAFLDANPLARGHTLVIPKTHAETLGDLDDGGKAVFETTRRLAPRTADAVDAPVSTVPMRARLIVVAAAVAAVVLGVFATDLIAAFEPVVEVSFQ